jgi:hypothetical protein
MRLGVLLLVLAALLLCAPREPFPDEVRVQSAAARSLVRGRLDVARELPSTPDAFTHVREGRRYPNTPPGLALGLLPSALLEPVLRAPTLAPWARLAGSALAALCVALSCVLFLATLRREGVRAPVAVAGTLALAFATGLCAAGRVPDGAALTTLLLYWALVRARTPSPGASLAAGGALAWLVLIEPSLQGAAIVLWVATLARRRDPLSAAAMGLPLAIGCVLVFLHRAHTGWFPDAPGDLLQGLDGLLLSTGKSVLLYSPLVALAAFALPAFVRTRRADALTGLLVALAVLIGAAQLHRWHGDPAWGPRRLAPLLPILAEPLLVWLDARSGLARRRAWLAFGALALVGVLVQALGIAVAPAAYLRLLGQVHQSTGAPGWFAEDEDALFIPQFSPLSGHAFVLRHLGGRGEPEKDTTWHVLQPTTPRLDKAMADTRIDWWALALPRGQAAAAVALLVALAAAGAWLTVRRLRMLG